MMKEEAVGSCSAPGPHAKRHGMGKGCCSYRLSRPNLQSTPADLAMRNKAVASATGDKRQRQG
jgi:hypothetical protein